MTSSLTNEDISSSLIATLLSFSQVFERNKSVGQEAIADFRDGNLLTIGIFQEMLELMIALRYILYNLVAPGRVENAAFLALLLPASQPGVDSA